jgi:hypothetical protein
MLRVRLEERVVELATEAQTIAAVVGAAQRLLYG